MQSVMDLVLSFDGFVEAEVIVTLFECVKVYVFIVADK